MSLSAPPRSLELIGDVAVPCHRETLEAQRRSSAITKKPLATRPVAGVDAHSGVKVEAEQ
jgi:hypothetical protein